MRITKNYTAPPVGRKPKYAFAEWWKQIPRRSKTPGMWLELQQPDDFTCTPRCFAEQVWGWARKENKVVHVSLGKKKVYLQRD